MKSGLGSQKVVAYCSKFFLELHSSNVQLGKGRVYKTSERCTLRIRFLSSHIFNRVPSVCAKFKVIFGHFPQLCYSFDYFCIKVNVISSPTNIIIEVGTFSKRGSAFSYISPTLNIPAVSRHRFKIYVKFKVIFIQFSNGFGNETMLQDFIFKD